MVEAVRLLALCGAGLLLYRLWRWLWRSNDDWRLRAVITTGFAIRLLLGQLLFWVSFAQLPVARSLQAGNGLWFFAQDARIYTTVAYAAAGEGLAGIAAVPRSSPSASYIQVLALFSLIFGHPIAVSLLLNMFCFLATCAIITRWSAGIPAARRTAVLVAVTVVSLAPGGMLWALQPLKDTFFQLAVVAFAGAAYMWQAAWRTPGRGRLAIAAAVAMIVTLVVISGVRWYLGLILLAGSLGFVLLVALAARHRRVAAFAGGLLVVFLMSRAYVFAAEPYLSPSLLHVLNGRPTALVEAPAQISERLEHSRTGFVKTGGGTLIRPGHRMVASPPKTAEAALPGARETSARRVSKRSGTLRARAERRDPAASTTSVGDDTPAAAHVAVAGDAPASPVLPADALRTDARSMVSASGARPDAEASAGSAAVPSSAGAARSSAPPPSPAAAARSSAPSPSSAAAPRSSSPVPPSAGTARSSAPPPSTAGSVPGQHPAAPKADSGAARATPLNPASGREQTPQDVVDVGRSLTKPSESRQSDTSLSGTKPAGRRATTAPLPPKDGRSAAVVPAIPKPAAGGAAQPAQRKVQTAPRATSQAAAPPRATPGIENPEHDLIARPQSRVGKLVTGAAAVALPPSLAIRMGLVDVRSQSKLWWYVELDTIFFDALLLFVAGALIYDFRNGSYRNGTFWLLLAASAMLGVALAYTVTNFGTLFRLRLMFSTLAALIPLTLMTGSAPDAEQQRIPPVVPREGS